ncbi:MAG: hypothetical protein IT443_10795 [Phycisphaeraceae bacterium]|nr:hypothetical protein [Phycisphaeraceae bacterium]
MNKKQERAARHVAGEFTDGGGWRGLEALEPRMLLTAISISDAEVVETDAGTVNAVFEVSLDWAINLFGVTVQYATANGRVDPATAGSDYTAKTGTVTFDMFESTKQIVVSVLADNETEKDEKFYVILSNPSNATIADGTGVGTIHDDDVAVVTIAAVRPAASEVDADGKGMGQFKITRTGAALAMADPLVVHYTVGGSATAGSDYQGLTGTAVIPAKMTSVFVTVGPVDDLDCDGPETVVLTLVDQSTYDLGAAAGQTATVTIADDEPMVTVAATKPTASEANPTAAGKGQFTFTRSGGTTDEEMKVYYTVAGTASGDHDYQELSGLVVIPAGKKTATVDVIPKDDTLADEGETVIVRLVKTESYSVGTLTDSVVTITDNEPVVKVTANKPNASETDPTGKGMGQFTFTRSGGSTAEALTVHYLAGGNATAGTDYAGLSGSVEIGAGKTSVTINIVPVDDAIADAGEGVTLEVLPNKIYNAGPVGTRAATVTIADNEPTVTVTANKPKASETDPAGKGMGQFTFTRTGGSTAAALTVHYEVEGNEDLTQELSGTVVIAAGKTTATVDVIPRDDAWVESVQGVTVALLSSTVYNLGPTDTRTATVSIADNEPTVSVTATKAAASETNTAGKGMGQFTITRTDCLLDKELRVNCGFSGTADPGEDYVGVKDFSVVIPAGKASVTVDVAPIDDALVESTQTVILTVRPRDEYRVNQDKRTATVTIADNEPTVTVTANRPSASETDPTGKGMGQFTITRAGGSTEGGIRVYYSVYGTAEMGADYQAIGKWVEIAAGKTSVTVDVRPIDDAIAEEGETVVLSLHEDDGYRLGAEATQEATVTIADNEPVVTVTANKAGGSETDPTGKGMGQFTVTRTGGSTAGAIRVYYSVGGTAQVGWDYQVINSWVDIAAGKTTATIDVIPVDDLDAEAAETLILTLNEGQTYTMGAPAQRVATVTIADNEPTVTVTANKPNASETDPTGKGMGQFTVTRTGGSTAAAMTVYYTLQRQAVIMSLGQIYQEVVIAAGKTSATVDLIPKDDAVAEDPEVMVLRLAESSSYRLGPEKQRTATVTIADNEPTVTVTANKPNASETDPTGKGMGQFTVTRTGGSTAAALTVYYTLQHPVVTAGLAQIYQEVVIAAGKTSVTVDVIPKDDAVVEDPEVLVLRLAEYSSYRLGPEKQRTATVTIADNEPTVTVTANKPNASETDPTGKGMGQFTLTRTGGTTDQDLQVICIVGGTAELEYDYMMFAMPKILKGQTSATVMIIPEDDRNVENTETVVLMLQASETYRLGTVAQRTATVSIADNEPTVTVKASKATTSESGTGGDGQFTLTRSNALLDQPLTVIYEVSGTATAESDYQPLPQYAEIPAGASSVTLDVKAKADLLAEGTETVILTLWQGKDYRLGPAAQQAATVNISNALGVNLLEVGAFDELGTTWNYDMTVNGFKGSATVRNLEGDSDQYRQEMVFDVDGDTLEQTLIWTKVAGALLLDFDSVQLDSLVEDLGGELYWPRLQVSGPVLCGPVTDSGPIFLDLGKYGMIEGTVTLTTTLVGMETVTVKAGTFSAYKVQIAEKDAMQGTITGSKGTAKLTATENCLFTFWVLPNIGIIKFAMTSSASVAAAGYGSDSATINLTMGLKEVPRR